MDLDELIPYEGNIQYADGTTDHYSFGKSQRAETAAKEAEKAKEREALKAEVEKILKDLQPELKYRKSASTHLLIRFKIRAAKVIPFWE